MALLDRAKQNLVLRSTWSAILRMNYGSTQITAKGLRTAGEDYVRSRLKSGGAMSRLLERMRKKILRTFAPLPIHTADDQELLFEQGGITTQDNTLAWLTNYIIQKHDIHLCQSIILEDLWAHPKDSALFDKKHKIYTLEQTVLFGIPEEEFSLAGIKKALKSISSFHYNGYILKSALPTTKGIPSIISEPDAEKIAHSAHAIITDAYDQDGLVVAELE